MSWHVTIDLLILPCLCSLLGFNSWSLLACISSILSVNLTLLLSKFLFNWIFPNNSWWKYSVCIQFRNRTRNVGSREIPFYRNLACYLLFFFIVYFLIIIWTTWAESVRIPFRVELILSSDFKSSRWSHILSHWNAILRFDLRSKILRMSFRKKSAGYLATLCYTLLFVVSSLRNTIISLFTFIFFKHQHCVDFLLLSILVVPKM